MIRVAVAVEATAAAVVVAAAAAVGQLPMGRTSITAPAARAAAIPVGRNHPQVAVAADHPGTAATAEAIVAATMAVVAVAAAAPSKTGPSHCPGTIGSKLSCSRPVTPPPRASTLIDMRTFRSRPLDQ